MIAALVVFGGLAVFVAVGAAIVRVAGEPFDIETGAMAVLLALVAVVVYGVTVAGVWEWRTGNDGCHQGAHVVVDGYVPVWSGKTLVMVPQTHCEANAQEVPQ